MVPEEIKGLVGVGMKNGSEENCPDGGRRAYKSMAATTVHGQTPNAVGFALLIKSFYRPHYAKADSNQSSSFSC